MEKRLRLINMTISLILSLVMIALSLINNPYAQADTKINTIPSDIERTSDGVTMIKMNKGTFVSAEWGSGAPSSSRGVLSLSGSSYTYYTMKAPSDHKARTYTDVISLNFENVGRINGRSLNARFEIEELKTGALLGAKDKEIYCICILNSGGLSVGGSSSNVGKYGSIRSIKHSVDIFYADTGETVDLPMFQSIADVDGNLSWYRESWESVSGYSGQYYKYPENITSISNLSDNRLRIRAKADGPATSGKNTYYKTGIYAETLNGKTTAIFSGGNCSTDLRYYSPYVSDETLFTAPKAELDKERVKEGEAYTYSLSNKMHIFYNNIMQCYSSLIYRVILPENVNYISCKLLNGDGEDITSEGTLTYEESTRSLIFEMGENWLNNKVNYNGQELKLEIELEAGDISNVESLEANHSASVQYEPSFTVDANDVKAEIYQDVKIKIIKKLPNEEKQYTPAHGDIVFMFKITGEDSGKCWYRYLNIDEAIWEKLRREGEAASENWRFGIEGEYIVASQKDEAILELPYDKYIVEEILPARFRQVDSSSDWAEDIRLFEFVNEKANWSFASANKTQINTLSVE